MPRRKGGNYPAINSLRVSLPLEGKVSAKQTDEVFLRIPPR